MAKLEEIGPVDKAHDTDIMLIAFAISGNTKYVERILDNYKNISDKNLSDSIRLDLLYEKFGPTFAPESRKNNIIKNLCTKYKCKENPNINKILETEKKYLANYVAWLIMEHSNIKNPAINVNELITKYENFEPIDMAQIK